MISDIKFGFFLTTCLFLIGSFFLFNKNINITFIFYFFSFFVFILSILNFRVIKFLKLFWFKLGYILHRIVNPIILIILFFGIITPYGLILKIFRQNDHQKNTNNKNSFWSKRDKLKNSNFDFYKQF